MKSNVLERERKKTNTITYIVCIMMVLALIFHLMN